MVSSLLFASPTPDVLVSVAPLTDAACSHDVL